MFFTNDDIRVVLSSNESLTGSAVKVCYKRPDQTIAAENPSSINYETDEVTYDFPRELNNTPGTYRFWLQITNSDQLEATSTELIVYIKKH